MPKRPRPPATTSAISTGCLTGLLFLIGGLTIGVDLFYWTASMQRQAGSSRLSRREPAVVVQGPQNLIYHTQRQDEPIRDIPRLSAVVADSNKEPVLRILQQAGITHLDHATLQQLPTWNQVTDTWGHTPVLFGLETCSAFRARVPEVRRMLGAAGMFSTGTNLVTHLLKQNCLIPARVQHYGLDATKEELGMRWQVPWGKHTDPSYREKHATEHAQNINKDDILPVVTIRNVWTWMQSMCHNPYSARWQHSTQCPNLRVDANNGTTLEWNNVTVTYGAGKETYKSLLHLWNDWYASYMDESTVYPLLMIRMEDLVFHTQATIQQVCECVGGHLRTDQPFQYIQASAKKDSPGHDTRTGYAEAWIKYSRRQVEAGFAHDDYVATLEGVSRKLMDTFHYQHPPSAK